MTEQHVLLFCVRVSDMPIPHTQAFKSQCSKCNVPVWVANSSPSAPPICLQCTKIFLKEHPDTKFGGITEAQIADAIAVLKQRPQ